MENLQIKTLPSQPEEIKPATVAGFRFLDIFGDEMGTKKYINYKPPKLHDKGKKWFVYYSFRRPGSKTFKRFKVYEAINFPDTEKEKREVADKLITNINIMLERGFNPFDQNKLAAKTWSLNQGLNYFKQNLPSRGLRKRTVQTYESVIRQLYISLKSMLHDDINNLDKHGVMSALRTSLEKKEWSNTTYNNNLTFIRSIFNYLIEAGIMKENPATKVKPLPETYTKNQYFDDETFEKIKKNADPKLLEFIMFLYHTGTRPNEARQLRYEHINHDTKLLLVPASISKNKKDDYVPLSKYILDKYKGKGLIFGTSVNHYSQKFRELKDKLKLPKEVNLYSVKHTRAVHLAQDGVSPYAIQELFRHSSLEITQKYLRDLGQKVNFEAAEKVR